MSYALRGASHQPIATDMLYIGLGWDIMGKGDSELIWHSGRTGGYNSFMAFDKKSRRGVVVLSNATIDISDIGLLLLSHPSHIGSGMYDGKHNEQGTAIKC